MFHHLDGTRDQFDLLHHPRWCCHRPDPPAAVRALVQIVFLHPVDLLGSEGLALMAGMSRLAANLASTFAGRRFGRLDDVTRRRFGTGGGVLREAGNLDGQLLDLDRLLLDLLSQLGNAELLLLDDPYVGFLAPSAQERALPGTIRVRPSRDRGGGNIRVDSIGIHAAVIICSPVNLKIAAGPKVVNRYELPKAKAAVHAAGISRARRRCWNTGRGWRK